MGEFRIGEVEFRNLRQILKSAVDCEDFWSVRVKISCLIGDIGLVSSNSNKQFPQCTGSSTVANEIGFPVKLIAKVSASLA